MDKQSDFNFKDLHVWQKAVEFAKTVIDTVENNSSERKHFRLLEQVESSATSVALNIADLPACRQRVKEGILKKSLYNIYI